MGHAARRAASAYFPTRPPVSDPRSTTIRTGVAHSRRSPRRVLAGARRRVANLPWPGACRRKPGQSDEKGPAARRRPMAARGSTRVGGVRGHVWAPQTKVRRLDRLARDVARQPRAPYLRRWALLIALASGYRSGRPSGRSCLARHHPHNSEHRQPGPPGCREPDSP